MKVIFSGLESSGKSLRLAMEVRDIVHRNAKWLKRSGIQRPLASNLRFSEEFEKYMADLGLPPVIYCENLEELTKLSHCDVIIDFLSRFIG